MSTARLRVSAFLPAVTVLAWALGFAWLLWNSNYIRFLQRDLWWLLLIGLVVSVLLLYPMFRRGLQGRTRAGSELGRWVNAGIVVLPLVYLFFAPATGLEGFAFTRRDVSLLGIAGSAEQSTQHEAAESTPINGTTLPLLELSSNAPDYEGARVSTIGRLSRDERLPEGLMQVYRFVVVCCAADASPVMLCLEKPAKYVEPDSWIRVEGVLHTREIEVADAGRFTLPVLEDAIITPVSPPDNPYLYPTE